MLARRRSTALACSASLVLLACREPTQITVRIETDLACSELGETGIVVGALDEIETKAIVATTRECNPDGRIGSLVAVPAGERDEAIGFKIATSIDASIDDCLAPAPADGCIVARRALRYIPHTSLLLPIAMRESCVGVACPPGRTCVVGECRSAAIDAERCAESSGCDEDLLAPSGAIPIDGGDSGGASGLGFVLAQQIGQADTTGVDLGDLDGDGDLDAFLATYSDQPDEVWLNDGAGRFVDSGERLGSFSAAEVVLGDFDGDADLDALVANENQHHYVYLNDSHAVFAGIEQGILEAPARGLAVGDLDRDGDLDAYLATMGAASDQVWMGSAGGFNRSPLTLDSLGSYFPSMGDLDGDADLDVFVVSWADNPHRVWLNDGAGTLADSGQRLVGGGRGLGGALGDLDGDLDLDAFVAGSMVPDEVWLNDGSGVFTDSGQRLGAAHSVHVALGDLDQDGDLDAWVATDSSQPDAIWLNDGAGTFTDSGQALGGSSSVAVDLGDLDGDGDLDAFVASWMGEPDEVWLNPLR